MLDLVSSEAPFEGKFLGVLVAVLFVPRHLAANLLDRSAVAVMSLEDLAVPIIEALDLIEDMLRWTLPVFFVHVLDVMYVVKVVGEPAQRFGDFGLSIAHELEHLGVLLA